MVFTAEDVCRIIEACGKARVSELKFGDLHVEFLKKSELEAVSAVPHYPSDTEISEQIQKTATVAFERDARDAKEERLAQMLIEDPLQAESLIAAGELEDDE